MLRPAKKLTKESLTTEAIQPVHLKFCVDAEYLESRIAMGLIKDVSNYDLLTNTLVREYLDKRSEKYSTTVSLK